MTPPSHSGTQVILLARPARRRRPAATVWRLLAYDAVERVPVADIAERWEPASAASGAAITEAVRSWVVDVLGTTAEVGPAAPDLAGPDAWRVDRTGPVPAGTSR